MLAVLANTGKSCNSSQSPRGSQESLFAETGRSVHQATSKRANPALRCMRILGTELKFRAASAALWGPSQFSVLQCLAEAFAPNCFKKLVPTSVAGDAAGRRFAGFPGRSALCVTSRSARAVCH